MSSNLRSLWIIGLGFAILFSLLAVGQYTFMRHELEAATRENLTNAAEEMRDAIVSADPWNLEGYRNITSGADTYIVVGANGTLIDALGFQPRMMPTALVPFPRDNDRVVKFTSDLKENWTLYTHPLSDGFVILGVRDEEAPEHLEQLFPRIATNFGANLRSALATSERKVPIFFDYAILDRAQHVEFIAGGIPLKTDAPEIPATISLDTFEGKGGSAWATVVDPALAKSGERVALVRDFDDVTDQRAMLHRAAIFNAFAGGILWLVTMTVGLVYMRQIAPEQVSCSRIPTLNEGETVEFKSSLRWDYAAQKPNRELEKPVIKAVAGFLNSEKGGTLIIGVGDQKQMLGLEPDYTLQKSRKDRDGFEQSLSQVLINAFGEACFARCVKVSFCTTAGKEICLVKVTPARTPIFVAEERGTPTMYVRAGNSTRPLSAPEAVAYATEHFGGLGVGWRTRRSRALSA